MNLVDSMPTRLQAVIKASRAEDLCPNGLIYIILHGLGPGSGLRSGLRGK